MSQEQRKADEHKIIKLPTDRRRIKLTAADLKYPPVASVRSILKSDGPMFGSPNIEEYPELYHICEICGIIDPVWSSVLKRWIKRSCACKRAEREEKERQEVEQTWLSWQIVNCYGGWLGPTYKDEKTALKMSEKTFESYITTSNDTTLASAMEFANQQRPKGNIAFHGSYGTGKTHLGAAILNIRRERWRNTTLFTSAPKFFRAYNDAKRDLADQTQFLSICQRVIQADYLYLDDIEKEWRGEWKQPELHSIYYYIFDERYNARRPTIVSTNEVDDLEKYIGAAAKSRLMSRCTVLRMFGEDYRGLEEW